MGRPYEVSRHLRVLGVAAENLSRVVRNRGAQYQARRAKLRNRHRSGREKGPANKWEGRAPALDRRPRPRTTGSFGNPGKSAFQLRFFLHFVVPAGIGMFVWSQIRDLNLRRASKLAAAAFQNKAVGVAGRAEIKAQVGN